jgi:NADH-quinone oxidoreductase subunit M
MVSCVSLFLLIHQNWFFFFLLGALGCVLSCVLTLIQGDMKAFIAYSSVVHISLAFALIFSFSRQTTQATILSSVSHGFVSRLLFL